MTGKIVVSIQRRGGFSDLSKSSTFRRIWLPCVARSAQLTISRRQEKTVDLLRMLLSPSCCELKIAHRVRGAYGSWDLRRANPAFVQETEPLSTGSLPHGEALVVRGSGPRCCTTDISTRNVSSVRGIPLGVQSLISVVGISVPTARAVRSGTNQARSTPRDREF